MKKLLSLFICFALVALYSCSSDDDDNNNNEIFVTVTAQYTTTKEPVAQPDEGALVFFFSDIKSPHNYTYELGGHFVASDNSKIKADVKGQIGKDGTIILKPAFQDGRPFVAVIESAYYKGKFEERYILSLTQSTKVSSLFKPE